MKKSLYIQTSRANERSGASDKTLLTEHGPVRVELPRDRDGSFAPILIPKHKRLFTGSMTGPSLRPGA
ncbi:Transposase%2C Mutator family [Achromobacter xylosoxidans]|jgi:transposase-like protein|nr:Transposase%2C Mutator family [Achromobacter xylosoxidans]